MKNPNDRGVRPDAGSDPPPELRRALDALPRDVAPERDLWPGIRARLEPRQRGAARDAARNRTSDRLRGPFSGSAWRQVLAALFFTALGASITWLAASRGVPGPAQAPSALGGSAELASADVESGRGGTAGVVTTARRVAHLPGDGAVPTPSAVEADFLRAKEALWLEILARRGEISPPTLRVVERNLAIIDQAIRELRGALAADPANPELEHMLYDSHRRSLQMLRRLAGEA